MIDADQDYIRPLAELAVCLGANVQPGQIVAISSDPGKEPLARAIAEVAYERGAKFVDLAVFDGHFKRARALHADPETLGYVPPWVGDRMRALGEHRAATVRLTGPDSPRVMNGVDPALLGRDMLPRVKETSVLVNERLINWTIVPCPTPGWAERVHPELAPDAALARLWQQIGHICRLDEPDPIAAWRTRMGHLLAVSTRLNELELDQLLYSGPGTELAIGLLPGAHWQSAELTTAEGITHVPNIPTEEVFTTPDPERADGIVRATKPLYTAGALIIGLRMRFEGGAAIAIEADEGAAALQALSERDAGAVRLGEVALVDRDSRIGRLDTVFYDTLLDENAASHIALGHGFAFAVDDAVKDRVNESEIHIDFMIGSNDLKVTGVTRAGREVPLLRDGAWQI